ncbi:DUF3052 family protein [Kaarinaea lacus]
MAGNSQTPLVKKLGLKEGNQFYVSGSPVDYTALLGSLPDHAVEKSRLGKNLDFIHYFTKSQKDLEAFIPKALNSIKRDGMIWISWPKKSSKISSDINEDTIRAVALPTGLVDVKVCAIDDIWSGLKLVIRKELR